MAQFGDLRSGAGLAALDKYLLTHSYIEGFKPTQADVGVYSRLASQIDAKHPSVLRWHTHISFFPQSKRITWPGAKDAKEAKHGAPGGAPAEPAGGEEHENPFDEDAKPVEAPARSPFEDDEPETEEEKAKQKKFAEKAKKLQDERAAKGKKKEEGKSTLILDVKPIGSDTDMKAVEDAVRKIEMAGLRWAGSELVPIGFGIKKLRIISVIVDELVSTDDLRQKIEEMEDLVQSTDIFAFNKV